MPDLLPDDIIDLASRVIQECKRNGVRVAVAESCTGGLVAAALTAIAGSSAALERGFVTYSNEAKTELLGVPEDMILSHGAVSVPTARAMAKGALDHSRADIAVSITGIAGPGGGSSEKPVGTVIFGHCRRGALPSAVKHVFANSSRSGVRHQAVLTALELLLL